MPAESRELTDTVVAVTGASSGIGIYGGILDRSDHDLQAMIRINVEGTVWAVRDPALDDYLQTKDVAHAIATVLPQPRRVRTTQWQLWSIGQSS